MDNIEKSEKDRKNRSEVVKLLASGDLQAAVRLMQQFGILADNKEGKKKEGGENED